TLQSGAWSQVSATLPSFAASNFVLNGGSFLRALGGNGSTATPYLLTDVYGLQGVQGFLGSSFKLANDIDAGGTSGWHGGSGFVRLGRRMSDGHVRGRRAGRRRQRGNEPRFALVGQRNGDWQRRQRRRARRPERGDHRAIGGDRLGHRPEICRRTGGLLVQGG